MDFPQNNFLIIMKGEDVFSFISHCKKRAEINPKSLKESSERSGSSLSWQTIAQKVLEKITSLRGRNGILRHAV